MQQILDAALFGSIQIILLLNNHLSVHRFDELKTVIDVQLYPDLWRHKSSELQQYQIREPHGADFVHNDSK